MTKYKDVFYFTSEGIGEWSERLEWKVALKFLLNHTLG